MSMATIEEVPLSQVAEEINSKLSSNDEIKIKTMFYLQQMLNTCYIQINLKMCF